MKNGLYRIPLMIIFTVIIFSINALSQQYSLQSPDEAFSIKFSISGDQSEIFYEIRFTDEQLIKASSLGF